MLRFGLQLCCILLITVPVSAQVQNDSVKSACFSDFNIPSDVFTGRDAVRDSILLTNFFYDKLKQLEVFVPVSGNPGSASFLFFDNSATDKLFTDGFHQFSPYLLSPLKNFPFENSNRRFTNISYHLASKKEQHIFVKHEQKIKPWLVAGLDFGALSAPGDFSRTLNANRNLDLYFGYEAPSKVYRAYISFTSNLVQNQENGGISSDSVFENASSLNTRTLPINLPTAGVKHRSREYLLKQEFNLTRLIHKADSVERTGKFKSGSLVLSHSIWYKRKFTLFTSQSADSNYFDNYYVDSAATYDSSFFNDLYQVAVLEYTSSPSASGGTFKLGAGMEYQLTDYETGVADTIFNSGAALVTAGYHLNQFHAGLFYSKTIDGDFKEGFRSRLNLTYEMKNSPDEIYLLFGAGKFAPSAKDILYVSNHYAWSNNFSLLEQYDLTAGFTFSKLKLNVEVRSRTSKNLIFYREDCLPQSFGDFVSVSDATISNALWFGKFGLDTKIVLSLSGNENVAPVPPVALYSSIYYQNRFFKNVLGFKSGIDVSYYSKYYGYGYMPATGVFYVQQEKEIGNYPQLGVFVNLKIKSKATLFIRLDHANAGLIERTYYGAYHYPHPGRTFKFGINWDLVD